MEQLRKQLRKIRALLKSHGFLFFTLHHRRCRGDSYLGSASFFPGNKNEVLLVIEASKEVVLDEADQLRSNKAQMVYI